LWAAAQGIRLAGSENLLLSTPNANRHAQDADAEVVVMVRALAYASSTLTMRTKLYPVLG
jgi:hypothetical protein